MMTLPVGRQRSLAALEAARDGVIALAVQREAKRENPALADLYPTAVVARIQRINRLDDGSAHVLVEGLRRVTVGDLEHAEDHWVLHVDELPEPEVDEETEALATALREHVIELAGEQGGALARAVGRGGSPGLVADRIASAMDLEHDAEVEVLLTHELDARLRLVVRLVNETRAKHDLRKKIGDEVRRGLTENQREHLLRAQLKAIHKELGDEEGSEGSDDLRERLESLEVTDEVREVIDRELKRLATLPSQHPEHNVARNYLQLIADLPWNERADVRDDIEVVAKKLDEDHHGLDDVKKRILEHMAVLQLSSHADESGGDDEETLRVRGTILALAGPPGVGKTSLGQSIADATGRPFVRIALGGVRDEAEVRGHRRTYVGAIPGRIVSALRKVKVKNPVVLLDEIDKLGRGWAGDPEAALLELLDPEQNHTFTDHYLELPFDLSEVMFIATANDIGRLSPPLRDRLEIVELQGYTPAEKVAIADSHLVKDQLRAHALTEDAVEITQEALGTVVRDYTREAGVRQLKREIGKMFRGVALEVARARDKKPPRIVIDAAKVPDYLGKPRFFSEVAERTSVPGVATGLAWTPVGGDILFIETSRMPGKGNLQITGQLGDVMKESARAALTYVRSNAERLGVEPSFLDDTDIHIHVPAGAVPKDGPSAGVTMFSALTSLLTGRRVRSDTGMTGEATLRGRVLPVGGIKAKVLAAHRAGLTRVVLPKRNERDLDDVPQTVRASMEVFFAEDMSEVLELVLEAEPSDGRAAETGAALGSGVDAPARPLRGGLGPVV